MLLSGRVTRIEKRSAQERAKPGVASLRSGIIVFGLLAFLVFVTYFTQGDPNEQDLSVGAVPPLSEGHLLGTDVLGRDLLAWCARGVVTSLIIGCAVVFVSAFVGVLVGAWAGYSGGWIDAVLMRLVDLQLAVPPLVIFLAASMVIHATMVGMIVLLASVSWVPYARLVRATVLVERQRGYIAAARLAGARRTGILFGHLVPASATPIVVFASLHIGFVILSEAALSFLGLGLTPPTVSLGYMISQGRDQLGSAWWVATVPGFFVVFLVVAANLVGDGLRDRLRVNVTG